MRRLLSGLVVAGFAGLVLVTEACLAAGIPEPGLTMYGVIRNDIGGVNVRMTSGTLTWTVRPPSGPPVTMTTALKNINDQFSYLIDIPFETAILGSPAGTNALQLKVTATSYDRGTVLVGTNAATIVAPATATFLFSQADRATVQRVDLAVAVGYPDRDGDGLPDYWEDAHFAGHATPDDDADEDGMSNLKEYLAGCDPNDPMSAFEFVEAEKRSEGGFQVRWSSTAGRYYRLARSTDLRVGFAVLEEHIAGTPPANVYVDGTATNSIPYFYRVEIE